MAYKLQLKRGASGSLPTGSAGEPLFTTDTNDLYIGTGAANQRFQKYIASGTSAQFLKGDGSLDSTTYTPTSRTLTINGTSLDLSANRTFNVGTVTTAAATTGGQVAFFNGATVITSVSGLYFDGVDKLGIGTASPTYNLDVTGTARMISSSNLQTLYLQNSGTGYGLYNQADSYFQGDVKFQSVTSTLLKVDASHKLIAAVAGTDYQAPITNPVTGTGTTNYLPKWTSGSAIGNSLVYDDGTNVGIGTASPSDKLTLNSSGSGTGFKIIGYQPENFISLNNILSTSNRTYRLIAGITSVGYEGFSIFDTIANDTRFVIHNTGNIGVNSTTDNGNRLQVTGNGYFSGNVGIGTSSPTSKLHVVSTNQLLHQYTGSPATFAWGQYNTSGDASINNLASANLLFATDNTERMRLDSSGNLGLGVVPSAWSTLVGFDIVEGGGAISSNQGGLYLTENAYYNAGWKYKSSTISSALYSQVLGVHAWYNAPSGTAGNAITFTQAMTLTASGRLLLGTTTEGTYAFTINDISGGNLLKITSGSTILDYYVSGGNPSFGTASNHDLRIKTNDVTRLTIASTGAATFSSSVQTGTPTGGTARPWKLGQYNATAPTATGYVEVEINGILYKLIAAT